MPNWTTNRLTVSGDEGELERFRSQVKGIDEVGDEFEFLLGSLVPKPDLTPLGNAPANGPIDPHEVGSEGGRAWRLVRWGTKWDVSNVEVEVESDRLTYSFLTAWSAPLPWLEEVSGLFPGLVFEFEYQDEGSDEDEQGIYIKCIFRNGEMDEGQDAAWRDMRVAKLDPYSFHDPWLYYFFAHPEELERADEVMSGPPPEEIAQWIEVKESMDARLAGARPSVEEVDTRDSTQGEDLPGGDPEDA